jgi:hypothetical protein
LSRGISGVYKVEKKTTDEIFSLKVIEKKSNDDKKEIESQINMSLFQFYLQWLWFTRVSKSLCFEIG